MPLLAQEHVRIPNKDILSWMYDEPQFDHSVPIYIDAYDASNSISAEQANILIRQLIAGFRQAGVREGDTVLVHAFNSIYYPVIVLGIIGCGAIYTGSNPAYTPYELDHAFRSCAPRLVICDPEVMNDGLTAAAQGNGVSLSSILIFDTSSVKSLRTTSQRVLEGFASWRSLLNQGEANWVRFDDEATSRRTVAGLFFSSGTTGLPKLTKLSHYNLIAQHTLAFEKFPRPYILKRLIALPIVHAATAPSTHVSPLRSGHPQVIMRRYDPGTFLEMCAQHDITDLTLVPPQVISLLAHAMPDAKKRELLRSIRLAYGGAAPLDAVTQSRFQALLSAGSPFTQDDDTGSVGRFLPNMDVKLLDDVGNELQDYSQPGELAIRGPTVTEGYVGVPRERDFDVDGYLRTGDVLYQDKKSKLWYIVDRKKEMIKVRGFQVAPKELEGVLLEHAGIADAAVIGVKGKDGSEMPRAYVVKKDVTLSETDVQAWIKEKLARYKWLAGGVQFVESIPKSPSGKILKRLLRESVEKGRKSKL
ncbi:4-coumarate-CoA ligase-like protein [Boeremia exigua]|uniref:4-coumarate-CoA ligase-like protein n=1 Tax=Boeremia exigua TaxID=749465 RepID=UPI001E8D391E|nr:4-coumarate-CoA ligase-like protein [Boeremia exigua]KAH6644879.1 4-coumarate-CoA ligase-like protein [Boeremia exigua]